MQMPTMHAHAHANDDAMCMLMAMPCARTAVTFMLLSASCATMAAHASQHQAKSDADRAGNCRSSSPGSPVPRPAIASATAASSAGRDAPWRIVEQRVAAWARVVAPLYATWGATRARRTPEVVGQVAQEGLDERGEAVSAGGVARGSGDFDRGRLV